MCKGVKGIVFPVSSFYLLTDVTQPGTNPDASEANEKSARHVIPA
jgi:hypothetical protein